MKYVCVLSTSNYLEGVLVLNENLKRVGSKYPLLCIINETIGKEEREILDYFQIEYKECPSIHYSKTNGIWKNTFDKINVFSLVEYEKLVYLDSDLLIRTNIDGLFAIDEFTMASDTPFKQTGNSAIMIFKPNLTDFENLKMKLIEAEIKEKKEIGDQEIICEYFHDADLLDESFNVMRTITNEVEIRRDNLTNKKIEKNMIKLYNRKCNEEMINSEDKIIHYIFSPKPWMVDIPYDDNYYYEYKAMLDEVRAKKMDYYTHKKKLLVISFLNEFGDNERKMIKSLKEQTYPNISFLFICEELDELEKYIREIEIKNATCLSKCYNFEGYYNNHDLITFIEPVIYLRKNCYEECIKQLTSYGLDCVQFDTHSAYDYYSKIYKKEEINEDNESITKNKYDKIYKREYINRENEIQTIGVLGNNFYCSLKK